ncbi:MULTISPECIES: TetR/AcrR family transcriptional regulator [Actinoalloteichus]|uniref:TetR/AcrR family transcriptional regulator n=1 Tax=Actinoalloteichus TaxID=65496 RepID=UPI000953388C|nr:MULTISPECIES: TetR/AcrR family transcriptional regulator C-terminal domain-containing protein [Actinoalloteichus]
MVVFAGQGDARRSMALLWRTDDEPPPRTGPGPRPALSVDAIVDAAIVVADAEGMTALSMRAVGNRLGRTAMALYTYVPSKSELIDLMYDRVLAGLFVGPSPAASEVGWRSAVTGWVDDVLTCFVRHPWVLQVSQARPVLGPNEYLVLETLLRILATTGLGAREVQAIVATLFHFVRGAAKTIAEARQAPTATGVTDEEWWQARSTLLPEFAPDFAERFPFVARFQAASARVAQQSGSAARPQAGDEPYLEGEARTSVAVGLAVLLDGIEATMRRARTGEG